MILLLYGAQVGFELGAEGVEGGEFTLVADVAGEVDAQGLAVEVAAEAGDVYLDGDTVAVGDGGGGADVYQARTVETASGVDAMARKHQFGGDVEVGGGKAYGASELSAGDDVAFEAVRLPQHGVGTLHVALGEGTAYA